MRASPKIKALTIEQFEAAMAERRKERMNEQAPYDDIMNGHQRSARATAADLLRRAFLLQPLASPTQAVLKCLHG